MIPIIDLSWRAFDPIVLAGAVVGDLYELAQSRAPELFVAHDRTEGWTALCIPEVVTATVDELEIDKSFPAAAVGLVDLLRARQMSARAEVPAQLAASMAARQRATAIHVLDDQRHPVGLFVPSVFAERLSRTSMVEEAAGSVRDAMESVDSPSGEIALLDVHFDAFHSESLNVWGPTPPVCEGEGLPHATLQCPCREHPRSACGPRTVSRK